MKTDRASQMTKKAGKKWQKVIRMDGRIEYICSHGVGHGDHIHGCDGCCSKKDYPLFNPIEKGVANGKTRDNG